MKRILAFLLTACALNAQTPAAKDVRVIQYTSSSATAFRTGNGTTDAGKWFYFNPSTGVYEVSALSMTTAGSMNWPDGVKQTFNPSSTTAGLNVGGVSGSPSSLADGDIWLDTSGTPAIKFRANNTTSTLGSGSSTWGSVGGTLSDQTDLASALAAKAALSANTFTASQTIGTATPVFDSGAGGLSISRLFSAEGVQRHGLTIFDQFLNTGQGYAPIDLYPYIGTGGTGSYDHTAAVQDRTHFNGSAITTMWGFITEPVSTSGNIVQRVGLDIVPVSLSGGATVAYQQGINIQDLGGAGVTSAAAITVAGSTVRSLHAGPFVFGSSNYADWDGVNKVQIVGSQTTSGQIKSTLATGTAPFVVASTTNVPNLNASSLSGATFAAPGAIGGTTPSTGAFTTGTFSTTLTVPNGAAPTTSAFGQLAGDNNAWAASRGAPQWYDGTANTYLIGALASDTPTNGQIPVWNTGGTITWETVSGTGDVTAASSYGTDNRIIRSDGTGKGTQASGISIDDNDQLSVTVDSALEIGITANATAAASIGIKGIGTGVGSYGVGGLNTTGAGFGLYGTSSVSGGVAILAEQGHASATALQIKNSGGFTTNLSASATALRAIAFPDEAGTLALAGAYGTDNRLLRSDGTGRTSQSTGITVDDSDNVTGVTAITATTVNVTALAGTSTLAGNPALSASGLTIGTTGIIFEGATADTNETLLVVADPTADRTWTIPDATDTAVGKATTDTLTNKTLVAPVLGAATATSINKVALTAPASGSTLTIADGKTLTVSQDVTLNRQSSTGIPCEFCVAASDETTAITTGTGKVTFRAPYAFTLTELRASVNTAPTGSTILIDVNETGTTVISTKIMIDASEKTSQTAATPYVISDSAIADDAEISVDFDQVGSSVAGAGVKVWIKGYR